MLPAREFPLDDAGRASFRSRWRELFEGDPSKKSLYRDVSNGVPAAGHRVLPAALLRPARHRVRLPARPAPPWSCTTTISEAIQDFWRDANSRYKLAGGDPDRPLLSPPQLFVPAEEFYVRLQAFPRIDVDDKADEKSEPASHRAAARGRGRPARARSACRAEAVPQTLGAARAGRRRVARPARDHGELLRRVRAQARRRAPASRISCRNRPDACSAFRRSRTASPCLARSGRSSPRPSSMPAWCAGAGAPPRSAPRSKACCATSPSSRSASRWCTSSTASAATRASSP